MKGKIFFIICHTFFINARSYTIEEKNEGILQFETVKTAMDEIRAVFLNTPPSFVDKIQSISYILESDPLLKSISTEDGCVALLSSYFPDNNYDTHEIQRHLTDIISTIISNTCENVRKIRNDAIFSINRNASRFFVAISKLYLIFADDILIVETFKELEQEFLETLLSLYYQSSQIVKCYFFDIFISNLLFFKIDYSIKNEVQFRRFCHEFFINDHLDLICFIIECLYCSPILNKPYKKLEKALNNIKLIESKISKLEVSIGETPDLNNIFNCKKELGKLSTGYNRILVEVYTRLYIMRAGLKPKKNDVESGMIEIGIANFFIHFLKEFETALKKHNLVLSTTCNLLKNKLLKHKVYKFIVDVESFVSLTIAKSLEDDTSFLVKNTRNMIVELYIEVCEFNLNVSESLKPY